MRLWSLSYAASLFGSSIASAAIAASIYRQSELRVSAVRFIFFSFFFYLWLWSLFRGLFYLDVLFMEDPAISNQSISESKDRQEQFDALGLRGIAKLVNLTRFWLSTILVLGDTFLMASSLWMFPLTWELSRLARTSMDRGQEREHRIVRWYVKWVHIMVLLFFIGEVAYTIYYRGFGNQSYRILISGNMIQAFGVIYIAYTLISLKCHGRKYETIHGAFVASPLYKRIKALLIVYMVFSFQYQIISLILYFSEFQVEIPTVLLGVSALLFNNVGTALSIVMGCSQECFVRSFRRYLPEEYTTAFYVSEPRVAMTTTAARIISPPMENPVFVFTDIECSSALWALEETPSIMQQAHEIHDDIMRRTLATYRGYEITTCGDAFQLAFHSIADAVQYAIEVQKQLVDDRTPWPKRLHHAIPATERQRNTMGKHTLKRQGTKPPKWVFNGLRVRMGIHDAEQATEGVLVTNTHPVTGKVTYTGLSEVIASEVSELGAGGEICVTSRIAQWIRDHPTSLLHHATVERITTHRIPQLNIPIPVFRVIPDGLEGRKPTYERHWRAHPVSIVVNE